MSGFNAWYDKVREPWRMLILIGVLLVALLVMNLTPRGVFVMLPLIVSACLWRARYLGRRP